MDSLRTLLSRNARYAEFSFNASLKMMPSLRTVIIGCVDPRVEPFDLLGLQTGETAIIRNVGGRVTDNVVHSLQLLHQVAQKAGGRLGSGWSIIVLHHSDCGITRLQEAPASEGLARYLGVEVAQLHSRAVADPHAAVRLDVAALKADPRLPGGYLVSGLVYDVLTGKVETVVQPEAAPMRDHSDEA